MTQSLVKTIGFYKYSINQKLVDYFSRSSDEVVQVLVYSVSRRYVVHVKCVTTVTGKIVS